MSEEQEYTVTPATVVMLVEPIVNLVTIAIQSEPAIIEDMGKMADKLWEQVSYTKAWPFPETMNKADELKDKHRVLKAIAELFAARKTQMDHVIAGPEHATGEELLKKLGM